MLNDLFTAYVDLHRSLGFKFVQQERLLRNFVSHAAAQGDSHIEIDTVLAWAALAPSVAQRRLRLLVVRRFALKLRAEDDRHEVPPRFAFGQDSRRRRTPHIYSPADVRRLLDEAAAIKPADSLRPKVFVTVFALLASCGLRISEALALDMGDVTADGLIIRCTKFRKTRLVPLHPTARAGLDKYLCERQKVASVDSAVFISMWGTRLSYSRFADVFRQLMRAAGLRDGPGTPGPCIHDLRHTFAVRSLEACPDGEVEISRHMIALSTYLGHAHPSDTFWYLQATPKLMNNIAVAGEARFIGGGE